MLTRNCSWWVGVLLALTVAGVFPSPSSAAAQTERVAVSFVTADVCEPVGEPIAVEGVMHLVHTFTATGNGGSFEEQIAQAHLVGVGLVSGDRYIFNATGHILANYVPNGASISMETDHAVRVRAGESMPLDDFYMRFTVTPGGTFVEVDGCR